MEALLEALETEDAETLVRAIEQCAGCLAADGPRHPDLDLVTRALVRRSEHPRAKVRQAVAEAAVHLPEETYEPLIARLLQDPNAFVKQAAVDTYDERSRRARTVHDCEELSAEILRLRTRIEDDYGKKVARLTDQLSNRVLSQFLDRFFHEIAKVTAPLRGAIADIRVEARATAPDSGAHRRSRERGVRDGRAPPGDDRFGPRPGPSGRPHLPGDRASASSSTSNSHSSKGASASRVSPGSAWRRKWIPRSRSRPTRSPSRAGAREPPSERGRGVSGRGDRAHLRADPRDATRARGRSSRSPSGTVGAGSPSAWSRRWASHSRAARGRAAASAS